MRSARTHRRTDEGARASTTRRTLAPWRLLAGALALSGCHHFNPRAYTNPETLFRDAMREFRAGHFQRALGGFQKLTFDLPDRKSVV